MLLKAPGIGTFMIVLGLTAVALTAQFTGLLPYLNDNAFWALLLAHVVLILGCVMRGL